MNGHHSRPTLWNRLSSTPSWSLWLFFSIWFLFVFFWAFMKSFFLEKLANVHLHSTRSHFLVPTHFGFYSDWIFTCISKHQNSCRKPIHQPKALNKRNKNGLIYLWILSFYYTRDCFSLSNPVNARQICLVFNQIDQSIKKLDQMIEPSFLSYLTFN